MIQRADTALNWYQWRIIKNYPPYLYPEKKQRVCIAGLTVLQPGSMVLDEPTSMLDPKSRKEVMGTLLRLQQEEGQTSLYWKFWH